MNSTQLFFTSSEKNKTELFFHLDHLDIKLNKFLTYKYVFLPYQEKKKFVFNMKIQLC